MRQTINAWVGLTFVAVLGFTASVAIINIANVEPGDATSILDAATAAEIVRLSGEK